MATGKLTPRPVFLHFLIAQAVVVGGYIRFERCQLLLTLFCPEKFIQN